MQMMLFDTAAQDINHLRDRLIARFGRFDEPPTRSPIQQLIRSLISGRTRDEASLPAYDPQGAQKLFDALKADGKPFNIQIVTYVNSDLKRLAAYIQQALAAYGNTSATITEVDQANLVNRCKVQLDFELQPSLVH